MYRRNLDSQGYPASQPGDSLTRQDELLICIDKTLQQILNKTGGTTGSGSQSQTTFGKYVIDLTVAHTDLRITATRPYDWLQTWSDGGVEGCTCKVGTQSDELLQLSQIPIVPISNNAEFIYFSNDVRQGRNYAVIYFVRGPAPLSLNYGGQDISLAELAARSGSIKTLDRRGDIVLIDDFQGNLNKYSISGTGYYALNTERALVGDKSLKVVTGGTDGDRLSFQRAIPDVHPTKWGNEVRFCLNANGDYFVDLTMDFIDDGSDLTRGAIRYADNNGVGEISYRDENGTWVYLADARFTINDESMFHSLKVVADFNKKQYVRAVVDGVDYSLKGIPLETGMSLYTNMTAASFSLETNENAAATAYFGGIIVTQNEP